MLRVRELSVSEGQALSRLVRHTRDVTVRTRAMVVLHSFANVAGAPGAFFG